MKPIKKLKVSFHTDRVRSMNTFSKINELVEAVNELIAQKDPEYKVPLSGDPEYNKKVSEAEKSTAQLDFINRDIDFVDQ